MTYPQIYTHARLLQEVDDELARAMRKHAPMHSLHEAYGVIKEEFEEYWNEVKQQTDARDMRKVRGELIQIAAMALRAIIDVVDLAEDRETDRGS